MLQFPLWPDESYLACNYLDRGYLDLLKPLDHIQMLRPLCILGASDDHQDPRLLRLFVAAYAFLCGIGSLFLFRRLAGRLLSGTALVLAFATFAVAYPIRYWPKPTTAALTFSSQAYGTTSSTQTVTVTNTGSSALTTGTVTATGDFGATGNCAGSTVQPGKELHDSSELYADRGRQPNRPVDHLYYRERRRS